jgi:hypothetical protein
MKATTGVLSIFILPTEIEDFGVTLINLKRNSIYLSKEDDIIVDITLCLSSKMTNWNDSDLSHTYIEKRFREMCEIYLDWCPYRINVEYDDTIIGCLSHRRRSHEDYKDIADYYIWLDTDIVFKDTTLRCMIDGYNAAINAKNELFVVTPQIVRQWDSTWDVLVNDLFKDKPLNYHLTADIYKDVLSNNEDIYFTELDTFKFAGGWFSLISNKLMDTVNLPQSFGHYGPDDTFIMVCCMYMKKLNIPVQQFVLKNLIVGEKYKYTANNSIKLYVKSIDRRKEFRKIADDNFNTEVGLFLQKIHPITH